MVEVSFNKTRLGRLTVVMLILMAQLLVPATLRGALFPGGSKPAEGAVLNYRLVGFRIPVNEHKGEQVIEIAAGWFSNTDSFKRNIFKTIDLQNTGAIAEVPSFGTAYTWRVVTVANTGSSNLGVLHHFSTGANNYIDTLKYRLRITTDAVAHNDAYVFSDLTKVLYNMKGQPVWYLPNIEGVINDISGVRNLRISPQATITFIVDNRPYEVDFDGNVLWRSPKNNSTTNDTVEAYHHEFRRLKSGNYMALGNESIYWKWKKTGPYDSVFYIASKKEALTGNKKYYKWRLGTLLEFNPAGKLVWSWKASVHLKETFSNYGKPTRMLIDNHENSFYFDEKAHIVYVSYKNKSQIVKIKYPEGRILNVYGNIGRDDDVVNGAIDPLFDGQHSCKVSANGYIYVFSNNMSNGYSPPAVVKLKEPLKGVTKLEKIWEYAYPVVFHQQGGLVTTSGGNVIELPDRSIFVSMCYPFGNVFIVDNSKTLLWDGVFERRNPTTDAWDMTSQYRASIIEDQKLLQKLVLDN